jgi:hypothetical protein
MTIVSENVGNIIIRYCLPYLSWPPWAAQHRKDHIYLLSHRPRGPRQVQLRVAGAGIIALNFANGKVALGRYL